MLATVDILTEFVHVMLHGILFTREIYPQGAFDRRKMYDIPVQICSHPGVAAYIDGTVEMVRRMLDAGTIQQVVVLLTDPDMKPVEKFTLEIGHCAKGTCDSGSFDDLFVLQQNLRAALLKLYVSNALLPTLPCECMWMVEVHTRRSTLLEVNDKLKVNDMMWVTKEKSAVESTDSKIIPLKSISTNMLTMQLFVQEMTASNS